jgi:hypothetical protein
MNDPLRPRIWSSFQASSGARWHDHIHGLATLIHETSGEEPSISPPLLHEHKSCMLSGRIYAFTVTLDVGLALPEHIRQTLNIIQLPL